MANPPAGEYRITCAGEAASAELAGAIAGLARIGDVIALSGSIGAGKTVFARGFVQALTKADEEVPSPTFTLLQTYDCPRGPIHHYDLYRLERAADAYEIGIEESFADAITLIEWPERIAELHAGHWLDIEFSMDPSRPEIRELVLRAGISWRERLTRLAIGRAGLTPAEKRND
ncbi:MAG: tRNA (adenosine(37)-N6)-threonylcarbamoyltransferase complex ATPase subunit type 1 TsaE [Alphaproteobacteria bacterium]